MARLFRLLTVGLLTAAGTPAVAQTFATPLPPGPGVVGLPLPGGPLVAPVLLPLGAPTAAPVAVYQYGTPAPVAVSQPAAAPASRLSVAAEFLIWFAQASTLPPLATATAPGVPVPPGGALDQPLTDVVFGGARAATSIRPGGRFTVGYALSETSRIEGAGFFLDDSRDRFNGASVPGGVTLGRPLTLLPDGTQTAVPVSRFAGTASTRFAGWEVNYRCRTADDGCSRLDLLAGFRSLHLGDKVELFSTTAFPLVGLGDAGVGLVTDSVRSRNTFYGPQVGAAWRRGCGAGFSVDALLKIALGVTTARADLDGSTVVGPAGVPTGLLAGASNTVHDRTSYFGAVPEAGLGVGYQLGEGLRVSAGYTLLYWSKVRRAADQIDLAGGTADRPAFRDVTGDYWAQGVRFGLEWRY